MLVSFIFSRFSVCALFSFLFILVFLACASLGQTQATGDVSYNACCTPPTEDVVLDAPAVDIVVAVGLPASVCQRHCCCHVATRLSSAIKRCRRQHRRHRRRILYIYMCMYIYRIYSAWRCTGTVWRVLCKVLKYFGLDCWLSSSKFLATFLAALYFL